MSLIVEILALLIIALIFYAGYQAMQPAETCGLSVTKPPQNSTAFPNIDASCTRTITG